MVTVLDSPPPPRPTQPPRLGVGDRASAARSEESFDLQGLGFPMAVCDLVGNLLALTPSARSLLSHMGVPCAPLPRPLPAPLWAALTTVPLGQPTEWRPATETRTCLGVTRHRCGDTRVVVLMREISDTQYELTRRLQQQRLEAIGRLVAGVAHDLRAPLSSILFGASVLSQRCEDFSTAELREKLEQIVAAAARQQATIAGLLDFARLGPPVKNQVEIADTFSRVAALLHSALREGGHRLETRVDPDASTIYGNPLIVEQILVNLVLNATESATRPVTVRLHATPAADSSFVDLHVCDDGDGIPEHLQARIFEPFFTTKPTGTGLGLITAREAATDQGGTLSFSPVPRGAHFVLSLPSDRTGTTREFPVPEGFK